MSIIKKSIIAVILLSTFISCGKYGYDFENGFQSGDTDGENPSDTSLNYVDKSMLDRARIYPGLVGASAKRIQDTLVSLDLDFRYIRSSDLKISVTPRPIFSTGLYAPAGENVKIVVPTGATGLTVQVGAHTVNLTGEEPLRRDPVIYTVKELFPGTNYVRNPYGGIIWIHAAIAMSQPVGLKFSNVARTSDFILGKSNQEQWLQDVANNDVPWLELRSERAIFTVPRSMVLQYRSELKVAETLTAWNDIYEKDYYTWMGLTKGNPDPKNAWPELPERGVLDIQLRKPAYAHSGQPWMATQDKHWFMQFSNADYIFSGTIDGAWGTYHEIGHNYQMGSTWSWSALGETTNNLFVFRGAHRLGNPGIAAHGAVSKDIPRGLEFAATNAAKNFNTGEEPFLRLTPFLQIFNKVKGKNGESGWDFWTFIYTKARNSVYAFSLDEAKMDFFYRALCEFTGNDYARFMDAWGIRVSSAAKRDMRNTYPGMTTKIWTYNPLTNTGGNDELDPKYDIIGSDFVWSSNMASAGEGGGFPSLSDGKLDTYWHTCYGTCTPNTTASVASPTYLDLDMKSPQAIRGVYYQNRQNNTFRRATRIFTKISENAPWIDRGELIISTANTDAGGRKNRVEMKFDTVEEIRFIRFAFTENNWGGEAHTAIAEAGAFYESN